MGQMVIMPKLGQTVEESTIVIWRKNEGDRVAKGDIIFEIETDKAVLEVESFCDGILLHDQPLRSTSPQTPLLKTAIFCFRGELEGRPE